MNIFRMEIIFEKKKNNTQTQYALCFISIIAMASYKFHFN